MRRRFLASTLIALILLLSSCSFMSNNNNDSNTPNSSNINPGSTSTDSGNTSTDMSEDLGIGLIDTSKFESFSIAKEYKTNYDLNDEVGFDEFDKELNIQNSIDDLIECNYERSDESEIIENGRRYKLSFDLPNNISLVNENTGLDSYQLCGDNKKEKYKVKDIKVGDEEVDYTITDDKITIIYDSPSDDGDKDLNITIDAKDESGKDVKSNNKAKVKVNKRQYDISISNTKTKFNSCSMDVNVIKNNNGNGGTLCFILSDGVSIIKEFELNEGLNSINLENLIIGHVYEYAIINEKSKHAINSAILKGTFSSLLPYKTIINDISQSSVSFNLSDKGTDASVKKIEIYDGNEIVYENIKKENTYTCNNLKSGHNYNMKIYYDYYDNGQKISNYFYKSFKTLKNNEKLVECLINYNRWSNNEYSWSNGVKLKYSDGVLQPNDNRIYFSKSGSIDYDREGNIDTRGMVLTITLPYDSIFTAKITSANLSEVYTRNCNLTNGVDYYGLEVLSYRTGKIPQSYFLKAGTYYLYSSSNGIYCRDIEIKSIMSQNDVDDIDFNDIYNIYPNENVYLKAGGPFNSDVIEIYKLSSGNDYRYKVDNSKFKYRIAKIQYVGEDFPPIVEEEDIEQGALIDSKYVGTSTIIAYEDNHSYQTEVFVYGDDLSNSYSVILDNQNNSNIEIYRNDNIKFKNYRLEVTLSDTINNPKLYQTIGLNDNDTRLSYYCEIDGVVYDNIRDLPNDEIGKWDLVVTYEDSFIGTIVNTITYSVYDIRFPDGNIISIDKDLYLSTTDNPEKYMNVSIIKEYGDGLPDYARISFVEIKELASKSLAGLTSAKTEYYLDEELNNQVVFDEQITGDFYVVTVINDMRIGNIIQIQLKSSIAIPSYSGTEARSLKTLYQGWNFSSSSGSYDFSLVTKSNTEAGLECAVDVPGSVNVQAFLNDDILTSNAFVSSKDIVITIISGSSSGGCKMNARVCVIDDNNDIIDSKMVLLSENKVTHENVITFKTDKPFTKIRIDNFIPDRAGKQVGIYSIDAYVIPA